MTATIATAESTLAESTLPPGLVHDAEPVDSVLPSGADRGALVQKRAPRRAIWGPRRATRHLVLVLVVVFVANLVLTQRGSFREASLALRGAQWMWLPALVAASTATYAMAAITLSAATRQHLRLRRTVAVQVAGAFTNRLAPGGLGGMATNVRYLERCGLERADALSAVSITWAAGVFVHVCIVITVGLLFWFSVGDAYQPNTPPGDYWPVIGGILVVLFAGGLVVRRCLRSRATAFVAKIRDNLADLRQRPHHLRRLLASSAGMTCSHTFALVISLQAFGGGVALVNIAIVYLAATGVAAAIPTPGGVGTLETALAAGLVDARTPSGTAMAAVLTYRLTTFWLPIIPGAVTFRILRRRRVL